MAEPTKKNLYEFNFQLDPLTAHEAKNEISTKIAKIEEELRNNVAF